MTVPAHARSVVDMESRYHMIGAALLLVVVLGTSPGARAASLDTTFGNEGRVVLDFGNQTSAIAGDLAIQPDGRIVAVGWIRTTVGLVRLLADGSLDPSFGNGGGIAALDFGALPRERTT